MYDSLVPNEIPTSLSPAIVAAYVNHDINPQSFAQAVARFPRALHVRISVHANGFDADALDCESGTGVAPADCPAWVVGSRARGNTPWVYCSQSLWPQVIQAFTAAHVAPPLWWIANTNTGPVMIPGTIGHQYTFNFPSNPYDTSVMADYIPGIDPAPEGPKMTPAEDAELTIDTQRITSLYEAVFLGGPSMPDGGKSLGQSVADLKAELVTVNATLQIIANALTTSPAVPVGGPTAEQIATATVAALAGTTLTIGAQA